MSKDFVTVEMTWKQAAHVIAAALEAGTGEGKKLAREELMRMAHAADLAADLQLNRADKR